MQQELPGELDVNSAFFRPSDQNSHGLSDNSPLVFERIVASCFDNPRRKQFPSFLADKGWGNYIELLDENGSAEGFLKKVNSSLVGNFNS